MVISLLQTPRERIEAEGMFTLKLNPGPGLCHVTGCRKKHADGKKQVGDVRFCHKHWQQRWRARNPKQAAFATLRMHARKRRIGFTLDFAFFVKLTDEAGYWEQDTDNKADRLSVDRIDITGPYSNDNVRIITIGENSAAGNRERFLPENVQAILARKRAQPAWQMTGAAESDWLDEGDPF